MLSKEEKLKQFERITHQIVDDWYERVKTELCHRGG